MSRFVDAPIEPPGFEFDTDAFQRAIQLIFDGHNDVEQPAAPEAPSSSSSGATPSRRYEEMEVDDTPSIPNANHIAKPMVSHFLPWNLKTTTDLRFRYQVSTPSLHAF